MIGGKEICHILSRVVNQMSLFSDSQFPILAISVK